MNKKKITEKEMEDIIKSFNAEKAKADTEKANETYATDEFKMIIIEIYQASRNGYNSLNKFYDLFPETIAELTNRGFKCKKYRKFFDQYPTITISW